MGFLEDAYEWVDERLGGILPGGYVPGGRTLEEQQVAQAQAQAQLPAARAALQQPLVPVAPAPLAGFAPTGLPVAPGVVAPAGARGRLMTLVARVMPTGQIIPVRQYPGSPALMSSDITAAKRVKRVASQAAKLFPKRGRAGSKSRYRAPRRAPAAKAPTQVVCQSAR